jgi:hypothetical protein
MKTIFLLVLCCTSIVSNASLAPWWIAHNQIEAALKEDPCFDIADPIRQSNRWFVYVETCSVDKAQSWQTIVSDSLLATIVFRFGSRPVDTLQLSGSTPTEQIQSLSEVFKIAFKNIPSFKRDYMILNPDFYPYHYTAEFNPTVIQVHVDDTNDIHGQHNFTAEAFYKIILKKKVETFSITTTTVRRNP